MIHTMHSALAERAVGEYRQHLAALGRAPATIELRCHYPAQLFTDLGQSPWTVSTGDVERWINAHDWSQQTHRIVLVSLRQFYAWAVAAGHVDASPVARLTPPRQPRYVAHPMPDDVYAAALERAHGDTFWILRTLAATGLRRSECASLLSSQLAGDWLTVEGKGGVQRRIPIADPEVVALIRSRRGRVFSTIDGRVMSGVALASRVRKATGGFGPHTLRSRYATRIYRATGDVLAVQQLLGHASLATTQTYLGLGEDRLIAAAAAA